MKKKGCLLVAIALCLALFGGCSIGKARASDLSAEDIIGTIGGGYDDLKRSIGRLEENEKRASSYSYKRTILGSESDMSVSMDDEDRVEKIVILTDTETAEGWKDTLSAMYGVSASNVWRDRGVRIHMSETEDGRNAVISIEKMA